MVKKITVITFDKNGSFKTVEKLKLRNPIEGETYAARRDYVKHILELNGYGVKRIVASWKSPDDYEEAFFSEKL